MNNLKTKVKTIQSGFEDERQLSAPIIFPSEAAKKEDIHINKDIDASPSVNMKERKKKPMIMVKQSFYLSQELDTRLRIYCALARTSMTNVINQCLPQYLDTAEEALQQIKK